MYAGQVSATVTIPANTAISQVFNTTSIPFPKSGIIVCNGTVSNATDPRNAVVVSHQASTGTFLTCCLYNSGSVGLNNSQIFIRWIAF